MIPVTRRHRWLKIGTEARCHYCQARRTVIREKLAYMAKGTKEWEPEPPSCVTIRLKFLEGLPPQSPADLSPERMARLVAAVDRVHEARVKAAPRPLPSLVPDSVVEDLRQHPGSTKEDIAERMHLSKERVSNILQRLCSTGRTVCARREPGAWRGSVWLYWAGSQEVR